MRIHIDDAAGNRAGCTGAGLAGHSRKANVMCAGFGEVMTFHL